MRQIFLSGTKGRGKWAWVDNEDYIELSLYKWGLDKTGYAVRSGWENGKKKHLAMHKVVMKHCPAGKVVDHIDRNKLNNQKENLRIVTQKFNLLNSALRSDNKYGVKGVYWSPARHKFCPQIRYEGKLYQAGRFADLRAALKALDNLRLKVYGEDVYRELHR